MEDMNIFDYLFNTESKLFNLHDFVLLKERYEVVPNLWINNDVTGVVIDINMGESYKVKFEGQGAYWIDGFRLKRK